jgi:uncharacterized protein (TIGR00369 family)
MPLGCDFLDGLTTEHFDDGDGTRGVELEMTDDLRGPSGAMHGGLVATLVDTAGASCLAAAGDWRPVATSTMSVQYLAPARVGPIRATGRPLRVSDTTGVAEVRVVDAGQDDRLVAVAHVSVRYLDGESFLTRPD